MGGMVFVPEGQADRSQARSAWESVPRKNRPVGCRVRYVKLALMGQSLGSAPEQKQKIAHRDRKDHKDLTISNFDQAFVDLRAFLPRD
jgi:hypothetical protein